MPRRPRSRREQQQRASQIVAELTRLYPEAHCTLDFRSPYELLVATILSAQCTDVRVNQVTPGLFARYANVAALAASEITELEGLIRSTGFFRAKARNLRAMAEAVVADHGGLIPNSLAALVALPGVGRKTANVVLGNAFGMITGVVVDTHVTRLSRRLGLSRQTDPVKIEHDLMATIPEQEWVLFSHRLIEHGRSCCLARKPRCHNCALLSCCPQYGVAARPQGRGGAAAQG